MKTKVLQQILRDASLDEAGNVLLKKTLGDIEDLLIDTRKCIPDERYLAVGHHMAEVIKRAQRGEGLAKIDQETEDQIEASYKEKSRNILTSLKSLGNTTSSSSEIILLAIHLQCASNGF
ncbi:PRD domain-containing protein [Propionispira raffinosivorans]|uniref:PRD domain-containing protein n=1 Tax=Propionispira raffinosivorans TaxID=86959 RepID=UPI000366F33F|nr:PRD domain-containing protein [Propionispira raffinosivorans]